MRVTLLPSMVDAMAGPSASFQYLTSIRLDDAVCLDAGSLGYFGTPAEQARVRHVFLSHSHIDHVGSLPIFLNNVFLQTDEGEVTVYAGAAVLDCLRRDLFNDRLWPDFFKVFGGPRDRLRVRELVAGQAVAVEGLRLTPIEVDHVVPTFGFLVEDATAAVLFSSDTGPTEALWERANRTAALKAVFLEVTFPDHLAWLADVSRHLTPALFGGEVRKVRRPVPIFAVHVHPSGREQVLRELERLGLTQVQLARPGELYEF